MVQQINTNDKKITPESFCYWLQGYFELSGSTVLSEQQVKAIKEHLNLVFNKVTTASGSTPLTFYDYGSLNTQVQPPTTISYDQTTFGTPSLWQGLTPSQRLGSTTCSTDPAPLSGASTLTPPTSFTC
jgi:hypothetical protein